MKRSKFPTLVLTLLVGLLAACSPASPASIDSPALPATQAPVESAAPMVVETVSPVVSSSPTSMPTEPLREGAVSFPTGKFVNVKDKAIAFNYNEDGTFEFFAAGKDPVLVGTYTLDGDLITWVNPTETDPKCMDEVSYHWAFDGEKLTFAPVGEDPCRPRREANADTYVLEASLLPEIKIFATDYNYAAPKSTSAGWTRVILKNSGSEQHLVQFLRLNDGVTMEQFEEALKQGEGPAFELVKFMGGVGAVAPSGSAQVVLNLPEGEYVIFCPIPSASDHAPHFVKGMISSLSVQPAGEITGSEPTADLEVKLADYAFEMPDTLLAGPTKIKVSNQGPEPHEFNILKLEEGKTAEDVLQYLSAPEGPPPFMQVGGMNGLDQGSSGYVEADLQPGAYAAICFIPSPKAEGHPHFALGMIKQFEVTAAGAD
jgi:hypothetical protein